MPLTPEELEQAKRELARINRIKPWMSPNDIALLKKYPKHTLAAARYIDSAPDPGSIRPYGCRCAFEMIRMQEDLGIHLDSNH